MDSTIAPSALNEKFFHEINCLAPFGSGNSEPKFVIENLKVINSNLIADKHIKEQAMKGVSLLNFLCKYVDRNVLDLSYKMYVRPHLDYGDIIFHNQRMDLMELIERVQYKAALIVSGCWQGTSRKKCMISLVGSR